jgi:anti-sigma regulatory factor (Ser/Thr protein kinase)/putative methionine-R-sulfoxide reductase with GAF domain
VEIIRRSIADTVAVEGDQLGQKLERVTEAALAYLDLDELLRELLERTADILEADTAAILLVEDDGTTLAARAAKGLEEEVSRGFRLPIGAGFAGRIAATRSPVAIPDLENSAIELVNPLMREKGVRSLLGVPLVVEGRLLGVMHVGSLSLRSFDSEDAHLLQLVADRAALAIERDRLYEDHRIAETLQRSVLPTALPEVPGLGLAARYLPAATEAALGGDWFDAIPLSDGRVGLAIGDVVGTGIEAAALMSKLRTAVRVFALENAEPAELVTRLSRFMASEEPSSMATFTYCSLEPDTAELSLAIAGHPPPLFVRPGGRAEYLELDVGTPLGVSGGPPYEQSATVIPPGGILVLYTDGLIERRGSRLSERQATLVATAAAAPLDPELLCAHLVDSMLEGSADDDVAVLAVQNLGPTEGPLELTVRARPQELAAMRRVLRSWLRRLDAPERDVSSITLACSEAGANAIEHAYGPVEASFDLRAEHLGGEVQIAVRDSGGWRQPRGHGRGRGIMLMRAFMDSVELRAGDSGTTVLMSRQLGGEEAA